MFFLLPRYSLIYSNQIFQLQKKPLTKCLHCLISNNVLAGSFFRKIRRNICRDMKADDCGIDSRSAHLEIQGQGNLGKRQLCHVLFSCRIFLWPLPISLPQSSSFLTEGCLLINGIPGAASWRFSHLFHLPHAGAPHNRAPPWELSCCQFKKTSSQT